MTRGKYAARAANRLAEIDAGLVQELRQKLAEVSAERDSVLLEAERLRREAVTEARVLAEELAAGAVAELAAKLVEAREAREADRQHYIKGISRVLVDNGPAIKAPPGVFADLADVFGLYGAELARFFGNLNTDRRNVRRSKTKNLRLLDEARSKARGTSNEIALRLADQS